MALDPPSISISSWMHGRAGGARRSTNDGQGRGLSGRRPGHILADTTPSPRQQPPNGPRFLCFTIFITLDSRSGRPGGQATPPSAVSTTTPRTTRSAGRRFN
ncbi:unnamed protein product [Tilletia controversa]|nr:unnamed protein product [Tilletia controversa]